MVTRMTMCHPALLTDITIAIQRHVGYLDRDKWFSYDSLIEMENRNWEGTSVQFTPDDAAKAVRELQAIGTLVLRGRDSGGILVESMPEVPNRDEGYVFLFHGLMGSYDNPTPLSLLKRLHKAVPLPSRTVAIAAIASEADFNMKTTVKALRELRLMNDLNYIALEDNRIKVVKKRPEISYRAYEAVLGADPYA